MPRKCKFATKYQPEMAEWKCPNCGKNEEFFYIDESDYRCEDDSCSCLHINDFIECRNCGKTYSGSRLSSIFVKKRHLVKCPFCNGVGLVKKEEGD